MDSGKHSEATTVTKPETKDKGKAVTWAAPLSGYSVSTKAVPHPRPGWKKGVAITDFILRLGAIGAALGSAVTMGTNEEILPFFTQFLQFHAQWTDFPMFQFFVVANGVIGGYMILALPFSYVCIIRPHTIGPRLGLMIVDIVMMGVATGAASSATAIVYLSHNGSRDANWIAICQGYTNFCQTSSEAVVLSFVAAISLMCLVPLSALALKRT
ncbi:hypothetical protein TanjilG_23666 [Lupinus angustifolius]|uniref:CASP-like protein n=1 Tax=Lupinus angustifolius TaxID=3871 RepID=A0A4P1RAC2_LUPAN|nr:PREDICTED: casparian strip membrane protein 5-like [Lupinus angustifolius]OIW05880.1 hypothetical protein TanjilG_23666 [Lupinus angustifolius]